MKGFRFALFSAAVLCLTAFAAAFSGMSCPGGTFRGCEERQDSISASRVPDSLRATLQQKLDSDTGLVFWGVQKYSDAIAVEKYRNGFIDAWFHDTISTEWKNAFLSWYNEQRDAAHHKLESAPEDLKQAFINARGNVIYALVQSTYTIKKIYDRKTRTWIDPREGAETVVRYSLVHQGPVVETDPPGLFAEISLENVHPKLERIFFEDGHSRIIDENQFRSIDSIAKLPGYYLPNRFLLEMTKDMSPVYKRKILDALGAGDRDAVRENMEKLDEFLKYADGKFFYSWPSPLTCSTKQLMEGYLHTFEDGLDCKENGSMDESERIIFVLLQDSLKAMKNSGELEKELTKHSASDRAFWRVLVATLETRDREKRNEIVLANVDSIKKIEQRDFVVNSFYKGMGVGWNIQMGMGLGFTFGLGDTRDFFPSEGSFDITLEFFPGAFGGGYNGRFLSSKNFDENKFQSVFLLDFYMGYRTFSTPYVENRIYAGPTLLFSDLMEKGDQEPLESHFGVGFHFGTAFDFYFTKYQEKGQLRLGLRLFASISNYYTDVVKGSDGGTLTLTLTPLLQYYELREKKYGER
ncbi:hypothetical protein [Fibrobacter sp. UBA2449]|uniref:hypothetical protein n=1 Tax=Fibrobacter sp. UBA2449 TaxID=1946529 RepID=UPI0025BEF7C0|nr:hypothetical protein [Fibrobacter sp. UBA2449]